MPSLWRTFGPWALLLVVALALSDIVLPAAAAFWSEHAMFTNLVSSVAFVLLTVTFVDLLLERGRSARREAVTSVAYNAIARAPMGQRRIMWHLVHGGEFVASPDFSVPSDTTERLRAERRAANLDEADETTVMVDATAAPDMAAATAALAARREWVLLAYGVLRDASYGFRLVIARWSALMIAGDDSVRVLSELGRQAEEFADLVVALLPVVREQRAALTDEERAAFVSRWNCAFANAIALDEALIRLGGERGPGWTSAARRLLSATDHAALERSPRSSLRLYPKMRP